MPSPSCLLEVAVIPNAPRNEIVGRLGDAVKVKIHAPPVEGRANIVLCEFLAATLGLPRRAVTLVRGDTSRRKLVRITGLAADEAQAKLGLQPARPRRDGK